jgi:hypothetical protein
MIAVTLQGGRMASAGKNFKRSDLNPGINFHSPPSGKRNLWVAQSPRILVRVSVNDNFSRRHQFPLADTIQSIR